MEILIKWIAFMKKRPYFDGLVQERRKPIANAMELYLSCTNPWIYSSDWIFLHGNDGRWYWGIARGPTARFLWHFPWKQYCAALRFMKFV